MRICWGFGFPEQVCRFRGKIGQDQDGKTDLETGKIWATKYGWGSAYSPFRRLDLVGDLTPDACSSVCFLIHFSVLILFSLWGSGRDFGGLDGGEELGEEDAGEDEGGTEEGAGGEALMEDERCSESAEDGFEDEDEDRLGGGEMALGVALDGEGGGRGEDGADDEREEEAEGEMGVGVALERLGEEHGEGSEGNLDGGEGAGREHARGAGE